MVVGLLAAGANLIAALILASWANVPEHAGTPDGHPAPVFGPMHMALNYAPVLVLALLAVAAIVLRVKVGAAAGAMLAAVQLLPMIVLALMLLNSAA